MGRDEETLYDVLTGRTNVPQALIDIMALSLAAVDQWFTDPDLVALLNAIRDEISKGARVLLVAHSQGNFYANRAYQLLTSQEQQYVDIVSVAIPTTFVADAGEHLNATNDSIINAVRSSVGALLGNCLNANTSNESYLHHGVLATYLNGDDCGSKFRGQMIDAVRNTTRP